MKIQEYIRIFLLLIVINCLYFLPVISKGYVPFPGDLLTASYKPWQSYSYLGYEPGAIPNKAQYFDSVRQIYPWKKLVIDIVKTGNVPLWNPYNFSGSPLLANTQSSAFYPLNILYLLFPLPVAWTFLVILQTLLASFFTYCYCRSIRISIISALTASIAFSFSLFMSVFLEYNTIGHVLLWLPLGLFSIEMFYQKRSALSVFLYALSIFCTMTGGHLQIAFISYMFLLFYGYARILYSKSIKAPRIMLLVVFSIVSLLSLGTTFIQLIPTAELVRLSARSSHSYETFINTLLIQPKQLLMAISPDMFGNPVTRNYAFSDSYPSKALYIGLIPFICSLLAIKHVFKNPFVRFYACIALCMGTLLIRSPLTEQLYKVHIPFFSSSSPTNMLFLLSFSLSVLAGLGIDWFTSIKEKKPIILITPIIFFTLCLLLGMNALLHLDLNVKNLLYSIGLLSVFMFFLSSAIVMKRVRILLPLFILIITLTDLFYFFSKFNPFVPSQLVFPQTSVMSWIQKNANYDRFWGFGTAGIEANFASFYNVFSPDGYDPLYPKTYGEFIASSQNGRLLTDFTDRTRSDAVISPGFGDNFLENTNRLKVMNLLGVKYILDRTENGTTQKSFPPQQFTKVFDDNNWRIYQDANALDRVFLADNYRIYTSKDEFSSIFFSPTFQANKTILLKETIPQQLHSLTAQDKSTIESYTPNEVVIHTETKGNLLLFLSDVYYPGWNAYIDDHKTTIYPADYVFRSIIVPKGTHTIRFIFQPQSFTIGLYISFICIVLLGIIVFIIHRTYAKGTSIQ